MTKIVVRLYNYVHDEVFDICNSIASGQRIAIIANDDLNSKFYSAIKSELTFRKIPFNDFTASQNQGKDFFFKEIIAHWADWQINRDIFSFLKFFQDLVAVELRSFDEFQNLNKSVNRLSRSYLTANCDIIFQKLNASGLWEIVKQYDMGTQSISMGKFLSKFENIFDFFLKEVHVSNLRKIFSSYGRGLKVSGSIPIKILKKSLFASDVDLVHVKSVLLSILPSKLAARLSFGRIFYSCTDVEERDIFRDYIFKKCPSIFVSYTLGDESGKIQNFDFPKVLQKAFCGQNSLTVIPNGMHFVESCQDISPCSIDNSIVQTKIAYESRNNRHTEFDEYSYAIDIDNLHHLECKAVELLLKNPAHMFYDYVLNLENVYDGFDVKASKKIFIGSLVHELLNVGKSCIKIPSLDDYYDLIDKNFTKISNDIFHSYAICNLSQNLHLLECLSNSKYIAHRLANKIVSSGYSHIATEVSVPEKSVLRLGEKFVKLCGRVDCILSHEPFSLISPSSAVLNIFDFKTTNYDLLTGERINDQLAEYVGIQLYMYGLAYKNFGFPNVNVQVMCHSYTSKEPINMDYFLGESGSLFSELSNIVETGIIGESEKRYSQFSENLPIATTLTPNDVILAKKQKISSKKPGWQN